MTSSVQSHLELGETPNGGASNEMPPSSTGDKKTGCIYRLRPNIAKTKHVFKEWFEEPINVVLFVWLCVVLICAVAFFLSLTGALNNVLHEQSLIDLSFEVPNQILNSLFTLLCIYVHPKRFYHLFLLCRWRPADVVILRKEFCKDGTCKPNEWINMMIVVILLHVNCFAQYAVCGMNLALRRSERPAAVLAVCLVVSVAAPVTAVILMNHGSLGRDYKPPEDVEAVKVVHRATDQPKTTEQKPEWGGGVLNVCDDLSVASQSFFCCFCLFGWNMERLGLGNRYVHISSFLLICTSPAWMFYLASARIENETISEALKWFGVLLSFLGLLHGGIWRVKMRKQYNLPPNNVCCSKPALADFAQWLFCCWCSLAQEVRTANYFGALEDDDDTSCHSLDMNGILQRSPVILEEPNSDNSKDENAEEKELSDISLDDTMTAPVIWRASLLRKP